MEILNTKQGSEKNINHDSTIFQKIDELIGNNRYDEALYILDSISPDNPNYTRALYAKSMILSVLQKNNESFETFQKSIKSDKTQQLKHIQYKHAPFNLPSAEDLFNYALTSYYFGDYAEAIDYLDLSLKISPNQSETVYYKALSLGGLGEYKKAINVLDKAIELDEDYRFFNDKGAFLSELGEFEKAHDCFNKSIEIDSNSYNWSNKAVLYHKDNDLKNALECYDKAIIYNSGDVYPIIGKAKVYMELGDFKNAEKYFDMAGEIDNTDLEYLIEKGKFLLLRNDYHNSIIYFNKCLKYNGQLAFVWMFKAMALDKLGRTQQMEKCIDRACQLDPFILSKFDELFKND